MDRKYLLGEDLFPEDKVLDPIAFDELVLLAQNINPDSGSDLRREFYKLINAKKSDALDIFNRNYSRIMSMAFEDEQEDTEPCPLEYEEVERLAQEIYDVLLNNRMWMDISIYYNGKRMSTSSGNQYRYNGEPFIEEGVSPKDYFQYCGNILSMSFEGPLYEAINYKGGPVVDQLEEVFGRHGLHHEMGDAWNLSLYR